MQPDAPGKAAAAGTPEVAARGIGAVLQSARSRMGVTPVQAAERLRVDVAVIMALEQERFDSLGPPVYVRGHLRRYADLLGEADAPLQAQYAALEASGFEPDLTQAPRVSGRNPPPRVSPDRTAPRLLWPLVLGGGAVVLACIVWLGLAAHAAP